MIGGGLGTICPVILVTLLAAEGVISFRNLAFWILLGVGYLFSGLGVPAGGAAPLLVDRLPFVSQRPLALIAADFVVGYFAGTLFMLSLTLAAYLYLTAT